MTDRHYRYSLWSQWASSGRVLNVIGLNPSTAYDLGGTVRRCIELAKHHGFDALHVTNLFARRSINPRQLALAADPVGAENDQAILAAANSAAAVVCAWGTAGSLHGRDEAVEELLHAFTLRCFGFTNDGHPRHPLYLPTNTPLMAYPDVKLCRIHDLREPCPDCMTPTPQMIAEGYAIHRNPTAAQRAAYASRLPGDDSPRPWWRWHEHWEWLPEAWGPVENFPLTRQEARAQGYKGWLDPQTASGFRCSGRSMRSSARTAGSPTTQSPPWSHPPRSSPARPPRAERAWRFHTDRNL